MSVLNDGNNLPGVLIDVEEEQAMEFDTTQWGTTASLLVIGTAHNGAPGIASRVYVPEQASYVYGNAYDSKSRTVGTLVPAIQDAYARGARTIYGMRVGGIDLYKDFKFRDGDSHLRLRLSSIYPTNSGKNCFIQITAEAGDVKIILYKPATRATISEKRSGVVESENDTIVTTYALYEENGLTINDKLSELINFFNNSASATNNVLRLSVVDEEGNNMSTSVEGQELRIGALFSGLYTIGRNKNNVSAYTSLMTVMSSSVSESALPYQGFDGAFFKTLSYNSDVNSDYPLYVGDRASNSFKSFQNELLDLSVTTTKPFDFLETTDIIDRVWEPDTTDYEEVDISKFELYKRLGSGFAITAKAVSRGIDVNGVMRTPRVIETPSSDSNRIVAINDGIYATLQNAEVDYRVLVAANADDKIADPLPKAADFKVAQAQSIGLLGEADGENALIVATPKVAEDDMSMPKKYTFSFYKKEENEVSADSIDNLYSDKVARMIVGLEKTATEPEYIDVIQKLLNGEGVPNNTEFVVFDDNTRMVGHIVQINDGIVSEIGNAGLHDELFMIDEQMYIGNYDASRTSDPFQIIPLDPQQNGTDWVYNGKQYMLAENKHGVFVVRISDSEMDAEASASLPVRFHVVPLGSLSTMLTANDDKTLIYAEDEYGQTNEVVITSAATSFMTLEELAAMLNEDSILGKIFSFELTDLGVNNKDNCPDDLETDAVAAGGTARWKQDANPTLGTPSVPGILYALAQDGTANPYVNKVITYDFNKYIPYRTSDNFARQLAQHCAYTTLRTKTTHGIIGLAPIRNLTLAGVMQRTQEVMAMDFSLYAKKGNGRYMLGLDNQPYSIGDKISVSLFQYPYTDDTNFTVIENGAAGYSGMVTTLPLTQSSTYQPINLASVDYRLSQTQLLNLSSKGFIVIRESESKGLCICDGVTMAPATELRRRLSISRIINQVGDIIRLRAEPFIGKNNTQENQNALKTAIDAGLSECRGKIIVDYTFAILNLNSFTEDAFIKILYKIQPINEIRTVENTIKVVRNLQAQA